MIIVNKIVPQTVEVFDNNDRSLGILNEYEFNDLRAQIAEQKVTGYYIMFDGFKTNIASNGKLVYWPTDLNEQILARIFSVTLKK